MAFIQPSEGGDHVLKLLDGDLTSARTFLRRAVGWRLGKRAPARHSKRMLPLSHGGRSGRTSFSLTAALLAPAQGLRKPSSGAMFGERD